MPSNQVPPEQKIVPLPPQPGKDSRGQSEQEAEFFADAPEKASMFHTRTGESSQEQAQQHRYRNILFEGIKQDIDERKNYASKVYRLACFWLLFIAVLFLLQGFNFKGFSLDNEVLKWAIVTMGLNVLGLLFAVIRYLFDRGGKIPLPDPSEEVTSLFPVPGVGSKEKKKK